MLGWIDVFIWSAWCEKKAQNESFLQFSFFFKVFFTEQEVTACFHSASRSFISNDQGKFDSFWCDPFKHFPAAAFRASVPTASSDVLSLSRIRVCARRIMTPLLLPTTPCWCLTTRAAAPQRAPLAPWTPPALENRTTTTSTTGVLASKSWQTSTEEAERTEGGNSRKTEGNGETIGFSDVLSRSRTPSLQVGWLSLN